jgi:hypothetical protein
MALLVGSIPHLRLRLTMRVGLNSVRLKHRYWQTQRLLVWKRGIGTAFQFGFEREGIWYPKQKEPYTSTNFFPPSPLPASDDHSSATVPRRPRIAKVRRKLLETPDLSASGQ